MQVLAKSCSACNAFKMRDGFQVRKMSKDGLTASCKTCLSERDRRRYMLSPERREYCNTAPKRYVESARRSKRKWEDRNPHKKWASTAVGNALRDGKIEKSPCFFCGTEENIHAHHHDYTKPLDVTWLCARCHRRLHAYENKVSGAA